MATETPTVAVIGGGLSGALVAERLLRTSQSALHVVVVDPREALGAGLAYSTDRREHVLNVPSKSMSAVDGESDHFLVWLRGKGSAEAREWRASSDANGFVPRGLYGSYVRQLLADAVQTAAPGVSFAHERNVAIALSVEAGRVRVALKDERTIDAGHAVLALGNPPPADPTSSDLPFYASPRYVRDAWGPEALQDISAAAPVLVLGTNLTMIDIALSLDQNGHRGTIVAISTHGLVPTPHRLPYEAIPPFLQIPGARITGLLRTVRERAGVASNQGHDWRAVMDAIRPLGQSVWLELTEPERRRFLRHLRAYWEIHRHRAAPAAMEQVARLRAMGRLVIRAGRISSFVER
ncbi:MAG TPA: FAD/NAD(P)-binding protein, partial [Candidatus Eisenbacteria bacterium]|nr:FAD/NAD(P)-binding protein [Candidatus Eisenbacteria bacterium]